MRRCRASALCPAWSCDGVMAVCLAASVSKHCTCTHLVDATRDKRSCSARSAESPLSKISGCAPRALHPLRRAHDDQATPDKLDRPVRASFSLRLAQKWQGHAGKAPSRVNPTSKESPI
jgi:hypothetical protein